eukprot:sb/3472015/
MMGTYVFGLRLKTQVPRPPGNDRLLHRKTCGKLIIESAFFRLFRHRVLLEFRLIWTLYLNLNLDIESTVDLECSTRIRITPPPNSRPLLCSGMMSGLRSLLFTLLLLSVQLYVVHSQFIDLAHMNHLQKEGANLQEDEPGENLVMKLPHHASAPVSNIRGDFVTKSPTPNTSI